ncbi:MAG TPA: class I SAM-dependent methyltransferase, partial [Aliiroseovarius sp.]|nr:class I SAM-dependent methyltransferase [Aliiroseovarius sp.]
LRKYIFPGGYIPAVSEVMPAIERAGLYTADLEVLKGEHYARTLAEWRARFTASRDVIRTMFDERFRRMWRFYLVLSETGFRELGLVVHHYQLSREADATPLTRDYLLG